MLKKFCTAEGIESIYQKETLDANLETTKDDFFSLINLNIHSDLMSTSNNILNRLKAALNRILLLSLDRYLCLVQGLATIVRT